MEIHVVTMLKRGGSTGYARKDEHAYIAGVYDDLRQAITAGEIEEQWNDGHFRYTITKHELNTCENWQDKLAYSDEQGTQLTMRLENEHVAF